MEGKKGRLNLSNFKDFAGLVLGIRERNWYIGIQAREPIASSGVRFGRFFDRSGRRDYERVDKLSLAPP
jgi:hypothetical protein